MQNTGSTNFDWSDPTSWSGSKGAAAQHIAHKAAMGGMSSPAAQVRMYVCVCEYVCQSVCVFMHGEACRSLPHRCVCVYIYIDIYASVCVYMHGWHVVAFNTGVCMCVHVCASLCVHMQICFNGRHVVAFHTDVNVCVCWCVYTTTIV